MMKSTYTTKEAAELTGASRQSIRAYTPIYARYLSTEATPEPGKARRFTVSDLKLLAYVRHCTSAEGLTHDQVQESLAAGELEAFDWQPPEEPETEPQPETTGALVPIEQVRAMQALLADAQRRESDLADRERELLDKIEGLERELGQAQGELAGFKAGQRKPPGWWRALFGGRDID